VAASAIRGLRPSASLWSSVSGVTMRNKGKPYANSHPPLLLGHLSTGSFEVCLFVDEEKKDKEGFFGGKTNNVKNVYVCANVLI